MHNLSLAAIACGTFAVLSMSLAHAGGNTFTSSTVTPSVNHGPVYLDPANMKKGGGGAAGGSNAQGAEGVEQDYAYDTSPNFSCKFQNYNDDGSSYGLSFRNNGDGIIKAGSKFIIAMPDGSTQIYVVPYDLEPGWGMGVKDLFPGAFPENWTCNVSFISA
jgi:hypothetical protein